MAKFEGIHWADKQLRYLLTDKSAAVLPADAPVAACSRSTNYAIFLAFEGIRFFCRKNPAGRLEVVFLNWDRNLERFRRGMAFNIGSDQEALVPTRDELEEVIIRRYFADPAMRPFLEEMAAMGAQGYLRPFTVDEEQSIGVTYPAQPSIRVLASRYDRYLGEPFEGVVIPNLVRAVSVNAMGCLKLGVNYLVSIKAIEAARKIHPGAAAALFLDDLTHLPIEERQVTEWDTSCCLFAFRDGTVVKIPESNLILPSVTIQGITAMLRARGVAVEERPLLLWRARSQIRSRGAGDRLQRRHGRHPQPERRPPPRRRAGRPPQLASPRRGPPAVCPAGRGPGSLLGHLQGTGRASAGDEALPVRNLSR